MPLVTGKVLGNGSQLLVVTVPDTHPWGSLNIVAANAGTQDAKLKIHITSDAQPNPVDCVEPGAMIPADGRYELSCRLVQAGEKVYVTAPADVAIRAEINLAIEE
jgi:hypothetical protein